MILHRNQFSLLHCALLAALRPAFGTGFPPSNASTLSAFPLDAGCALKINGAQGDYAAVKLPDDDPEYKNMFVFSNSLTVETWFRNPPHRSHQTEQQMIGQISETGFRLQTTYVTSAAANIKTRSSPCYPAERTDNSTSSTVLCPYGQIETYHMRIDHPQKYTCAHIVPDGGWHHVAYVWDEPIVRLYFDGELVCEENVASSGLSPPRPVNEVWIGKQAGRGFLYEGVLDEVRLWNVARTQAEVVSTMYGKLPAQPVLQSLLLYFSFDECQGLEAHNGAMVHPKMVNQKLLFGIYADSADQAIRDSPTFAKSPLYVESGAPVFNTLANASTSSSIVGAYAAPGEEVSFEIKVLLEQAASNATVVIDALSSNSANLTGLRLGEVVLLLPCQANSNPLLRCTRSFTLSSQQEGMLRFANSGAIVGRRAIFGEAFVQYHVMDERGSSSASSLLSIFLYKNRKPSAGNAGYSVRFDGKDDYLSSMDFVFKHKTRSTATREEVAKMVNSSNYSNGRDKNGIARTFGATVEWWMKLDFGMMKEQDQWQTNNARAGGTESFVIGNSETPTSNLADACNHDSGCLGRFVGTVSYLINWQYTYFMYGWLDAKEQSRSHCFHAPFFDTWLHIAFVADMENNRNVIYYNGVPCGEILDSELGASWSGVAGTDWSTGTVDGPLADLKGLIVGGWPLLDHFQPGIYDEFRIWRKARTQDEIVDGMHRRLIGDEDDLVGYWMFDDASDDGKIVEQKTSYQDQTLSGNTLVSGGCGRLNPEKQALAVTGKDDSQVGEKMDWNGMTRDCIRKSANGHSQPFQTRGDPLHSEAWPLNSPSNAPLGGSTAVLRPFSNDAATSGKWPVALFAFDPDYDMYPSGNHEQLTFELLELPEHAWVYSAPEIAKNESLSVGSKLSGSQFTAVSQSAQPLHHKLELIVEVQEKAIARRPDKIGSITYRVIDSAGAVSDAATVQLRGKFCPEGQVMDDQGLCAVQCSKATDYGTDAVAMRNRFGDVFCACQAGDFRLDDASSPYGFSCFECLEGMICSEQDLQLSNVTLKAGYWQNLEWVTLEDAKRGNFIETCGASTNEEALCLHNVVHSLGGQGCREGMTGPFCASCKHVVEEFLPVEHRLYLSSSGTCDQCSTSVEESRGRVAWMLTLLAFGLLAVGSFVAMLADKCVDCNNAVSEGADFRGAIDLFKTKGKILVGMFQITSQLHIVFFHVTFPPIFAAFASWLSVFSIDIFDIVSFECASASTYFDKMLFTCLVPVFGMLGISAVLLIARLFPCCAILAQRSKRQACLLLLFLMYPMLSAVIMGSFVPCKTLLDGSEWFRLDYSVQCNSETLSGLFGLNYDSSLVLAAFFLVLYPLGIPAFIFAILYMNRKELQKEEVQRRWGSLYTSYKPHFWWWEAVELSRKFMLTGLIVLAAPGSASQLALATILAVFWGAVYHHFQPYEDGSDYALQVASNAQTFCVMFLGLLEASGTLEADGYDRRATDTILMIMTILPICMASAMCIVSFRRFCSFARTMTKSLSESFSTARASEPEREPGFDESSAGNDVVLCVGSESAEPEHSQQQVEEKLQDTKQQLVLALQEADALRCQLKSIKDTPVLPNDIENNNMMAAGRKKDVPCPVLLGRAGKTGSTTPSRAVPGKVSL